MVAVSHGYAWECQTQEGGWGLHEIFQEHAWKLRGVVNGIDTAEWHPDVDPYLQAGETEPPWGAVQPFTLPCPVPLDTALSVCFSVPLALDARHPLPPDGYVNYDADSLSKKAECKAALQRVRSVACLACGDLGYGAALATAASFRLCTWAQPCSQGASGVRCSPSCLCLRRPTWLAASADLPQELGLPVNPDIPMLGFIGRLDYQKGVDLIRDNYDWLMGGECGWVGGGGGDGGACSSQCL